MSQSHDNFEEDKRLIISTLIWDQCMGSLAHKICSTTFINSLLERKQTHFFVQFQMKFHNGNKSQIFQDLLFFKNGVLHRERKPAIILHKSPVDCFSRMLFYENGKPHNQYGPAYIGTSSNDWGQYIQYWYHGQELFPINLIHLDNRLEMKRARIVLRKIISDAFVTDTLKYF
jgi:hypothetical protein